MVAGVATTDPIVSFVENIQRGLSTLLDRLLLGG
jgi:hypothetical protein